MKMKTRITFKAIRENYPHIINVGFCDLQRLLVFRAPDYYISGVYGWNCDVYVIRPDIVICTGYRTPHKLNVDRATIDNFEMAAEKVCRYYNFNSTKAERRINELIEEFINMVVK